MVSTAAGAKRLSIVPLLDGPLEAVETMSLGIAGVGYEIDLTAPDAARLREAIADFITHGQQGPTSKSRTPVGAGGAARFIDATMDKVRQLLTTRAASSPELLTSEPDALAEHMVASIPTRNAYDDLVGPFYDTSGLRKWLGLSRQALASRVDAGSLLACPTQDGQLVYPAWQFRSDGTTVPHLPTIIKILRPAIASPWTIATWLRAPSEATGGLDAVTWLTDGGDPGLILAEARDDAARWAHLLD